jgi:hypothetical protein
MDLDELFESAEGAVILTGFDEAIIGLVEEFGNGPRILYSRDKILDILQTKDGMTFDESLEFYDFNILGMFAGEQNPVILYETLNTDKL